MNWTYGVEVDDDAADVGGTDRDHAEEAVFPASEQRNALIQDKQVLEALSHPGRHGKEFACKEKYVLANNPISNKESSLSVSTNPNTYRRNAFFSQRPTLLGCGTDDNRPEQDK